MYNKDLWKLGDSPNAIRELFAYGLKQAAIVGEENVFDFSIGNPSIPSPTKVNQSIHQLVEEIDSIKLHGYSMSTGMNSVRDAIARDLSKRYDFKVSGEEIFLCCGAAPGLTAAIRALIVDSDSEFLVEAPYFPEYQVFVCSNHAKLVVAPPNIPSFQLSTEKLEPLISPNTQALIINSPNNPTGAVYTEETLTNLAQMLTRKSEEYGHPIYIISDEPYRELAYDGITVPFVPKFYKNTIVVYSYSKSLSLPGERIGYFYVPFSADDGKDLYLAAAGASRVNGHICAPTLQQRVIEACAEERPDLEAYDENRKLLYTSLTEMGYECVKPDGAFYMFVKAPNGNAKEFSEKAKLKYNLLVVPADSFGCPTYFRLSYCVSNRMIRRSLPAFQAMMDLCRGE